MLAYVGGKICVVDGYGLVSVCVVYGQLAIHHADFTYTIRQHISSLRRIQ
jgi:hypothetical protein